VKDVFAARHIGADQLPAASPSLLPLNKEAEEKRAASVEQQFGPLLPESCNTPPMFCSAISGCALTLRLATEVW
jgi:hypothetical protein